jgi:hypothetical protein
MNRFFSLLLLILFALGGTRLAQADYENVPPGAPMYEQLHALTRVGWTNTSNDAGSDQAHALTRYEIALETAKAILAVTAREQAEHDWKRTASRPAAQALRELTTALRPELQKLGFDIPQTLALLDELLATSHTTPAATPALAAAWSANPAPAGKPLTAEPPFTTSRAAETSSRPPGDRPPGDAGSQANAPFATSARAGVLEAPISQRLRLYTALSTVARPADPLAQASWFTRATSPADEQNIESAGLTAAGATLSVTDWLRLRAAWNRLSPANASPASLSAAALAAPLTTSPLAGQFAPDGANAPTSLGGGLDVALLPGLTLSGEMARVAPGETVPGLAGVSFAGTRLGGGLGLSAWQNRLVLRTDLARLIPESEGEETTTAKVDLGLNLNDNLRLRLLYQQLFGPQTQTRAGRMVAGGLSVQF